MRSAVTAVVGDGALSLLLARLETKTPVLLRLRSLLFLQPAYLRAAREEIFKTAYIRHAQARGGGRVVSYAPGAAYVSPACCKRHFCNKCHGKAGLIPRSIAS